MEFYGCKFYDYNISGAKLQNKNDIHKEFGRKSGKKAKPPLGEVGRGP